MFASAALTNKFQMRNRTPLNNRGQRNFDSKRTSRFKSSGNGQSKSSSIDPKHFVKKAVAQDVIKHTPTQLIEELPVNPKIVSNLLRKDLKPLPRFRKKPSMQFLRVETYLAWHKPEQAKQPHSWYQLSII